MFGLGISEILFIGVLALILIGPEELPEVARTLGRFMNEIRRGSESFREEIRNSGKKLHDEVKIPMPDLNLKLSAEPEQLSLTKNPDSTSTGVAPEANSIFVHPEMTPRKKDEPS